MKKIMFLLLCIFALAGCSQTENTETCPENQEMIGEICCYDDNGNGICDVSEQPEEPITEAQPTCEAPNVKIGESCCLDSNQNNICDENEVEPEPDYISVSELETAISEEFSDINTYYFVGEEREDPSDFEKTYEVKLSRPKRFRILELNKPIQLEEFSQFISQKYADNQQNSKNYATTLIDQNNDSRNKWSRAFYKYDNELERINEQVFYEKHFIVVITPLDNWQGAQSIVRIYVWCSPDIILEVQPKDYYKESSSWGSGTNTDDIISTMAFEHDQFKIELKGTAKQLVDICAPT